jgi:MFS transporter, SET family, sugar efflux transporter
MPAAPPNRSRPWSRFGIHQLASLLAVRFFWPVTFAILSVGLGDATGGSYLTLFAVDKVHLSPIELGIFLSVLALSGIIVSTTFGRWFDQSASFVPLFLALSMMVIGYALLPAVSQFYLLVLLGGLPLGTSAAAFPLLFALAKGRLDQANAETTERGIAVMRTTWSMSWAVGPALAALLVTFSGFPGVFLATALFGAVALFIVGSKCIDTEARPVKTSSELLRAPANFPQIWLAALSLTLFHTAMFMGSIALPIVVTRELNGTNADVGFIFSVCAFLEVLVMLVFVLFPSSPGDSHWISAGFLAFILYFVVMIWTPSVPFVLGAQLLRAVGIGLIGYQGISYVQALMPNRTGSAAALFSNTTNGGFLVAGIAAGAWAQFFGYRSTFLVCAGLSCLGFLMLHLQSKIYSC